MTFCKFKRASDQEYISFVQTFESNYNEFKKLGEELSGMFLSLFLLSRANLPEIDYQIITSGLDFQSKTVYEDTKSALKKQQYSKDVKSQEKPEASKSAKSSLTMLCDLLKNEDLDEDELENIKTLLVKKENKSKEDSGKLPYKCWRCICNCPRKKKCKCQCTQHSSLKCPSLKGDDTNPKKKKKTEKKEESDQGQGSQPASLLSYCDVQYNSTL